VLILDGKVTGLIDFYFACSDSKAYDLAVTHAAWCFNDDGSQFNAAISEALLAGYIGASGLSAAEREALPTLARGASLRFLLTRLYDWINTPAGALVSRKDPLAFLRRLDHYSTNGLAC
jgi:homoserine kinase type II